MPIRLTGMASGMDTEAMISELVSAYRLKSQKYKKAQTNLSWKQDKWNNLNKKIKSLYTTLGNMKLSNAYNAKTATISDPTKATVNVSSSAVNGTYSLKIVNTAKAGYITGSELGKSITKNSTLADLGITANGTISVTAAGKTTDIEVNSSMKMSEFVEKLNSAGVKANYDEANHRMYVAASDTGKDNDFSLSGTGMSGADALEKLGLSVESSANTESYKAWAAYALNTDGNPYITFDADGGKTINGTYDAAATKNNIDDILVKIRQSSATHTNNTAEIAYANAYKTVSEVNARLSDPERDQMQKLMLEGDISKVYVDGSGNFYDIQSDGTYKNRTDDSILTSGATLTDGVVALSNLQVKAQLATKTTDASGKDTYTVDAAAMSAYQKGMSTITVYEANPDNTDEIAAVKSAYAGGSLETLVGTLQADADSAKQYVEANKLLADDTMTADSIMNKINFASGVLDGSITIGNSNGAKRVDGLDAVIELNGAVYTSSKNDFNINGLTVSALASTGSEEITINVANNVQGLYDNIKDFFKQYNSLINELTGDYNAPTTKGYEPLTSEEKDAMSDTEVAEWEKKIKDSVLRRDDTLEFLISNMQSAMMKSYEVDGKKYSLSSFGISTLGVLKANDNEENAFHINGDKDDALTQNNQDKLMSALTNNPEVVTSFMQQLCTGAYNVINEKMKSTGLSSFDIVYNDKEMAKEYSDYTTTIKKWEEKLKDIEDSYYKKFAAMESALATLQSQQSSLASLLGS